MNPTRCSQKEAAMWVKAALGNVYASLAMIKCVADSGRAALEDDESDEGDALERVCDALDGLHSLLDGTYMNIEHAREHLEGMARAND